MRATGPRLPLFRYFAVVGVVLVGAMYAAEGYWGRPEPLKMSTDSYGVPARRPPPADSDVKILTVRDAPAPDLPKIAPETTGASAQAQAEAPKIEQPKKASKSAAATKKRATKVVRKDSYDRYADWRDSEAGVFNN